jgi:hypothetical protein
MSGSKYCCPARLVQPEPAPPWRRTAGLPFGLPIAGDARFQSPGFRRRQKDLETQCPEEPPIDLSEEVHIRAEKRSLPLTIPCARAYFCNRAMILSSWAEGRRFSVQATKLADA